jgi:Icc-related predicted phosphoesterase
MKATVFDNLKLSKTEYVYYKELKDIEKIDYLFELYDVAMNNSISSDMADRLVDFFNSVKQQLDETELPPSESDASADEQEAFDAIFGEQPKMDDDTELVDIMIDEENIMIETNSLKALRYTVYKFAELGYILMREPETEKMFKPSKITKYLRVYKIIDQTLSICLN